VAGRYPSFSVPLAVATIMCCSLSEKNSIADAQKDNLLAEKKRIEESVSILVGDGKQLEADVSLERKNLGEKEKDLQINPKGEKMTHQCQLRLKTFCFSTTFQQQLPMVS
jgi:hypothetical protein